MLAMEFFRAELELLCNFRNFCALSENEFLSFLGVDPHNPLYIIFDCFLHVWFVSCRGKPPAPPIILVILQEIGTYY